VTSNPLVWYFGVHQVVPLWLIGLARFVAGALIPSAMSLISGSNIAYGVPGIVATIIVAGIRAWTH
jgi:hypothetical protein